MRDGRMKETSLTERTELILGHLQILKAAWAETSKVQITARNRHGDPT